MRRKDTVFFLVMPTVAPCLNVYFHTDNMFVALLAFIPTDKSPNVDDHKAYRTTIIPKVKNNIQDSISWFLSQSALCTNTWKQLFPNMPTKEVTMSDKP